MEKNEAPKKKVPIFIISPKDRKVAVGEYSYVEDINSVKTIVVSPKKGKKSKIKKSESDEGYLLVNLITCLFERDYPEKALELISMFFDKLSLIEKRLLVENIFEATKQYRIPVDCLPDSYFDFLASNDSDIIFMN